MRAFAARLPKRTALDLQLFAEPADSQPRFCQSLARIDRRVFSVAGARAELHTDGLVQIVAFKRLALDHEHQSVTLVELVGDFVEAAKRARRCTPVRCGRRTSRAGTI